MQRLSIVIPVLDEGATLRSCLAALAALRAAAHEVIVVDGGSQDDTIAQARDGADRVIAAPRGRATQMNAGAAIARGDVLVFLHADTRLPDDAATAIAAALASGARWGRFVVTIAGRSRWLPLIGAMMNLRSRLTGIATGDQAIFVTRSAFAEVGGFPALPLMEDVVLSATLRRVAGRPACLRQRVVTSGRRWDANGAFATMISMWRLRFDHWRGVDPAVLARRYESRPSRPPVPRLLVFAKEPAPGRVKTRLARAVGDVEAAAIYRELAVSVLTAAATACADGSVDAVELWCDPDCERPAFAEWRRRFGVLLRTQRGADLGARMRGALLESLARGQAAIVIGTDCPALDAAYLARAAAALASHDVVVGPAADGGYVLIGLARDLDVFAGIAWSTADVMAATRARVKSLGSTMAELPALWDIDTLADLERYREGSRLSAARSPASAGL
ncbi:MAG TPA: TIGR04283 family arsenosugar biosynthesis glycosyltransferase [Casimicrobiaceae bacterium]|nr:TIGR04283 family arsenosugar biosynthesis glycosyltransferase [Casimicrobiaceae bacterium]